MLTIEYTGQRHLKNQDAEVYAFETNLKMLPRDDEDTGRHVPGFFELLSNNQSNPSFPYSVVNAGVKYKKKGTGINGIPVKMVKKQVPVEYVELTYERYRINQWMFEVICHDASKLVVRFWDEDGSIEVASFEDVPGRVEDFINEMLYDENEEYEEHEGSETNEDGFQENNIDEDEEHGATGDLGRYTVDEDTVNDGSEPAQPQAISLEELQRDLGGFGQQVYPADMFDAGDVPLDEPSDVEDDMFSAEDLGEELGVVSMPRQNAGGLAAFAAVEAVLFLIQLVPSVLAGYGILAIASGAMAVLALVAFIVSLAKAAAIRKGTRTGLGFPKFLVGIGMAVFVMEFIACIVIGTLWYMRRLPPQLGFLYSVFAR